MPLDRANVRPTFDPARRDKNEAPTRVYQAKALPAHSLNFGIGTEVVQRDLLAQLLQKEAEQRQKAGNGAINLISIMTRKPMDDVIFKNQVSVDDNPRTAL